MLKKYWKSKNITNVRKNSRDGDSRAQQAAPAERPEAAMI